MNTTEKKSAFSSIIDNNKQEMNRIEDYKREKISATPRNLAFVGISFVGLIVASFLALQIITGVLALITVAVTGVAGFFGMKWLKHLNPIMKQKMKNKQLKIMMEEARKNAIQQLENQVIDNAGRLGEARQARNKMGSSIEKLKSKVDPANKGKPIYDKKMEVIQRLETAYIQVKENLDKAAKANIAFEMKVKDYKDMEAFASEAGAAMALFEATSDSKLEEMLSLEAFNHIDDEFSTALISIENSARDMVSEDS